MSRAQWEGRPQPERRFRHIQTHSLGRTADSHSLQSGGMEQGRAGHLGSDLVPLVIPLFRQRFSEPKEETLGNPDSVTVPVQYLT